MNFFKDTIKYISENFFKLILFTIVPSIALAFTGSLSSFITFFLNYNSKVNTLFEIYTSFTFIGSFNWFLGILSFFVLGFFLSLLYSALDRHMKVGKFSFSKPFTRLNEGVITVFPVLFFLTAGLELTAFINSVVIYLLNMLLGNAISLGFSIAFTVLTYSGIMILYSIFSLIIPSSLVAGYPMKDAIVFSTTLVSGKAKRVFVDLLAPILVCLIISAIMNGFLGAIKFLVIIVDVIIYNFLIIFIVSYTMVSYFDLTKEPRRDLEVQKKNYLT